MTVQDDLPVPKRQIFRVPLQIYDIAAKGYRPAEIYIHSPKSDAGTWTDLKLKAQNSGLRLAYSSEWYNGRQYLEKHQPQAEKDFIEGPLEWTESILDFNGEELLEGIVLNPDGSVAAAKTRLGKEQGIVLPHSSSYVKDLDDKYMPLVSHLWGVQNPKTELPDYTYLWINPGFRPVVRGYWHLHDRADRRVTVHAEYGPANRRFAARLVGDIKPQNSITPAEYAELSTRLTGKEAEIRARLENELEQLRAQIDSAVVLVE